MIEFPCRCKYFFQLPADQAGLSVQCPQCGLLVDVPNVGDVGRIEPDGTYRLDTVAEPLPDNTFKDLALVYYPQRQLPDGTEIDLRGAFEPAPHAPLPSAPADELPPRDRPKYDPETGELIPPLEFQQTSPATPQRAIPQATRVIDYNRSPDALEVAPNALSVFGAMFLPTNLAVMLIIVAAHLVLAALLVLVLIFSAATSAFAQSFHVSLLIVFPILVAMLIAGHYAVTLEEIARNDKDDLPRILRNVQIYDDYLVPAGRTALALLLCYWPALIILRMNYSAAITGSALPFPTAGRWLLIIYLLGSIFLPAVFLTICTSGTILNLRPDRVIRLIYQVGVRYLIFVAQWLLASNIYLLGAILLVAWRTGSGSAGGYLSWLTKPYVTVSLLVAGIYLTFVFCWHLGLHYRQHWQSYPWIMQFHEHRTVTIIRPAQHPKVAALDENAAKRAKSRQQIR